MGWLEVFLLVLSPGIELRGAIPYGIATGMDPIVVGIAATVANILLVFPLFFFLDHVFPMFESWTLSQKLLKRARRAAAPYVDQYGRIGLALFVAVPLPGSGVYSGALAAYVLGVPRKSSMVGIGVGAALAGMLVTCISAGFLPMLL
ncbi:MAG: small multi-drug export protein [Candidatus Diapherotrites archaeon]|nr:small multi-drug export protein [Candidatus Diapherotrites archaeon]